MRHLKTLNMSFNLLSEWDDVPMNLEKLILSNNKILDITAYVTQMSKIYWLDLSCNVIPTVVPLNRVQSIKYLFMKKNRVSVDHIDHIYT